MLLSGLRLLVDAFLDSPVCNPESNRRSMVVAGSSCRSQNRESAGRQERRTNNDINVNDLACV